MKEEKNIYIKTLILTSKMEINSQAIYLMKCDIYPEGGFLFEMMV